jgi:hypothetical protein
MQMVEKEETIIFFPEKKADTNLIILERNGT